MLRAATTGKTEAVALLIKAGANVNQTDSDGQTPLAHAAANGRQQTVELLLSEGNADVEKVDKRNVLSPPPLPVLMLCNLFFFNLVGASPLYLAAYNGHTEVIEILLEHGAEINKGNAGKT